jgi:PKD repeat protein
MRNRLYLLLLIPIVGLVLLTSCSEDEVVGPPQAGIFLSVADKQVAFTSLTINVDTWVWDFGDGQVSNEEHPVHIYEEGGVYSVKLVATGPGGSAEATTEVSLALSVYEMLTGGSTLANGKTWKISSSHSALDRFALADANMTTVQEISPGLLGNLGLGLAEVYEDQFTFMADGSYIHNTGDDGAAFAGLVHSMLNGLQIANVNPVSQSFGLCTTAFTSESGAKFTLTEDTQMVVSTIGAAGPAEITYSNVSVMSFTGNEFVRFMDFQRDCILQEVTVDKMRLAMFVSASPDYYPLATHAIILTFEAVQ